MEKAEQEIEKVGPVVMRRPKRLLPFPPNADRCTFALSNHPHGPSGENSSRARDAIIKSQPHFGFSVVFQRITLSFLTLGGNQRLFSYLLCFLFCSFFWVPHKCWVTRVNKPLNQTDQVKDYCLLWNLRNLFAYLIVCWIINNLRVSFTLKAAVKNIYLFIFSQF